jgi:hypothetical protein
LLLSSLDVLLLSSLVFPFPQWYIRLVLSLPGAEGEGAGGESEAGKACEARASEAEARVGEAAEEGGLINEG